MKNIIILIMLVGLAGCDNGLCTYPGCNQFLACNFDFNAGCDDGSCIYPGCNDLTACNYTTEAICYDNVYCLYVDTDSDGKSDYIDTDSDGDLIPDAVEAGSDGNIPTDTDKDGIYDFRETDSDKDGINDSIEAGSDKNNPVDTDGDGTPDYQDLDSDGDTIPDKVEGNIDTDGDGKANYIDTDSDNDELLDINEAGPNPNVPQITNKNNIPDYIYAEVTIPEGFSPNGDADNDVLYIKGLKVFPSAEITIINRNGQVVYESGQGYKNNWDGTNKGSNPSFGTNQLPEGIYFYVFKFNGQNRQPISGNIYIKP
jgi:gliding motility-associated-like protein